MAFYGPHTPETLRRIAETRRRNADKISAALKESLTDPEVRASISKANRRRWAKWHAAKESERMTPSPVITIVPSPDGMWALRCGTGSFGQFKSFREAQLGLRSLLTPDEFDRRFPETAMTLRAETTDRPHRGGRGRLAGYAVSA